MKEVKRIFEELQSTNSVKDKKQILEKYKNNQLMHDVLRFLLNDFIVTGISSKKMNKKLDTDGLIINLDIRELLSYLKNNNTGRDENIATVQKYIENTDGDLKELIKGVACKNLKLGLTAKTYNKAFPDNKIPVFDVMLAKKYEDHEQKVKGNFVITTKLDGNRMIIVKENNDVKCFSRKGQIYQGLRDIENDIRKLPLDNIVFDGEVLLDNVNKLDSKDLFRATQKLVRAKKENKKGLVFHIFDVLSLEEFQNGKSKGNTITRKAKLSDLFKEYNFNHCKEVEPLYIGSDKSQIETWLNWALDSNLEGVMINLDSPYVCKRTDQLLKVKVMNSCDLKIVGFEEGTGKYKGKLGRVNVQYRDNIVGVGSGFSDVDRDEIWNNQEKYLGKIMEVQFFEETQNQDGSLSLRFPVYKGVRWDKDKPSYN